MDDPWAQDEAGRVDGDPQRLQVAPVPPHVERQANQGGREYRHEHFHFAVFILNQLAQPKFVERAASFSLYSLSFSYMYLHSKMVGNARSLM